MINDHETRFENWQKSYYINNSNAKIVKSYQNTIHLFKNMKINQENEYCRM